MGSETPNAASNRIKDALPKETQDFLKVVDNLRWTASDFSVASRYYQPNPYSNEPRWADEIDVSKVSEMNTGYKGFNDAKIQVIDTPEELTITVSKDSVRTVLKLIRKRESNYLTKTYLNFSSTKDVDEGKKERYSHEAVLTKETDDQGGIGYELIGGQTAIDNAKFVIANLQSAINVMKYKSKRTTALDDSAKSRKTLRSASQDLQKPA